MGRQKGEIGKEGNEQGSGLLPPAASFLHIAHHSGGGTDLRQAFKN